MEYKILAEPFPYILFKMNANDEINCEAGAMSWRTEHFTMDTDSGGFNRAFGRIFSGEKMFLNKYTATRDNQELAISSHYMGKIIPFKLESGRSVIVQKGAILAQTNGIEVEVEFHGPKLGFLGGEGFIMQRVYGNGTVFLEVDGDIKEYELKAGEKMVISTGYLFMMEDTCDYDIKSVGEIKNSFFGGEGFFNTIVTGPGKLMIQTAPLIKLADSLQRYFPPSTN